MARLRESDALPAEARRCKERIQEDSARRPTTQCPKCGSRQFQRHQRRWRWFLPMVECIVWPIRCLLVRWLCTTCGTTFTHLPALCVPFKRYLRRPIEVRAQAYVETAALSYRHVVQEGGAAVVYSDPIAQVASPETEKEAEAVRALAPSTVHRWITHLASRREQRQRAVRLARQLQPEARLSSLGIAAAKYRRAVRQRVLEACGLLLRALAILRARNPTQLATLGSSP